ncbi:hypothetical protein D3C86_1836790 [compost metagenome]
MLDRTVAVTRLPLGLDDINFILKLVQRMAVECWKRCEVLNLLGKFLAHLPLLQILDMYLQLIQRNLCTIIFFH